MELNQIRYFLEVAESQHITSSAQKLHIAQPALSQAIRRLEKDLRVPLFVQKGRNIVLTEYGKYLKERLEPVMRELDSIPAQLQTMAALENETIHLNVLAASTMITEAIIEYKKTHSQLSFCFLQSAQTQLYDIGITTEPSDRHTPDSGEAFVCTEKIFLAVPLTHRLAGCGSVKLSDAADEGFISLMGSKQLRWICDSFCRHAGFSPKIIFESDSPAAVRNMIASNMGVGFWPEFTWGQLDSDKVVLLEIEQPVCSRDIIICCRQNKVDSGAVVDFYKYLKDFCRAYKEK